MPWWGRATVSIARRADKSAPLGAFSHVIVEVVFTLQLVNSYEFGNSTENLKMTEEIPADEALKGGRSVQDERFAPYFLTVLSNKFFNGTSRVFRARFGVGLNEWRLLSALRNVPGNRAQRISKALGVSKSIISRSSRQMISSGLVTERLRDGQRLLWLTDRGVELHDTIIQLALRREAALLDGFSEAELDTLFKLFRRMEANLKIVEELDREMLNTEGLDTA